MTAVLPAALAVTSGLLAAELSETVLGEGTPFLAGGAAAAALALGVVFLLLQVLPPLSQAWAESLGRRLSRQVGVRVMSALQRPAHASDMESPRLSELVSGINAGMSDTRVRDAVVGVANVAVIRGGAVIGAFVLFAYRWWVAVLLLAAYAYAMTTVSRLYQRGLESAESTPALMRRVMYLKDTLTTPAAGKEIRVFGLADWLIGRYRREWGTALAQARGGRGAIARVSLLSGGAVLVAQTLAFVLLALDARNGDLSIGRFTTFAVAAVGLVGLTVLTPDLLNIALGGALLAQVRELEEHTAPNGRSALPEPAEAGNGTTREPDRPPALTHSIIFENVGFRYPGSDVWVLRHLDLTIEAGTSIAIVGVNGAGKTTLVKLLSGLYEPTEGRILVDGVDLAHVDTEQWWEQFAVLFQDWIRWGLTVRENVLMGAPDKDADPAALEQTARAAGLDEVVTKLPDGWSTILDRAFGGVDLSGGQWQRVGIARALWALYHGAGILILDEPTSALDVRGETELHDLLLDITENKTVVLISHRFSTVRRADRIVVLSRGAVTEQGSHDELVATDGDYAQMFRIQADRFTAEAETP
ncbi:ABC transporter ATP-binding protein/permease [Streptomyces anulatus]|uniref:ABC transporter ATP-binding protein n=1 Tax=Streptomyces anulatus TaxID=1892 RepID=UPI002251B6C5|nr:ABC transporter ATP-binding protein [Streptomyces anulatus]MCX4521956.1 ABC transporter ATP-binding protein/permease [Streptomyces anulatus]MCX4604832.1 ABC transporter ATP-binding protein/permease [Streptomyces anulatus]WTE29655.1 ABC transporter ATP-binding protein/permease [Streptomyces anulatus]